MLRDIEKEAEPEQHLHRDADVNRDAQRLRPLFTYGVTRLFDLARDLCPRAVVAVL
jgi:hypothetical protein